MIVDEIRWRRLADGTTETIWGCPPLHPVDPAKEHLEAARYWYRPPAHTDEPPLTEDTIASRRNRA